MISLTPVIRNIKHNIPDTLPDELTEVLMCVGATRIERIVSYGHKSAIDFWYKQDQHEWVILIDGQARLEFSNGEEIQLSPGDYVNIPKGVQHRVVSTAANEKTIWLAMFYNN